MIPLRPLDSSPNVRALDVLRRGPGLGRAIDEFPLPAGLLGLLHVVRGALQRDVDHGLVDHLRGGLEALLVGLYRSDRRVLVAGLDWNGLVTGLDRGDVLSLHDHWGAYRERGGGVGLAGGCPRRASSAACGAVAEQRSGPAVGPVPEVDTSGAARPQASARRRPAGQRLPRCSTRGRTFISPLPSAPLRKLPSSPIALPNIASASCVVRPASGVNPPSGTVWPSPPRRAA